MTRNQWIAVGLAVLVAFASGRWLAPTKVETVTKTVEVDKKSTDTDVSTHQNTTTVVTKKPDGTVTTTTSVTNDTAKDKQTVVELDKSSVTDKTVTRSSDKVTISALGGIDTRGGVNPMVYGGSVSKPILGPVAVGLWGLSNMTFGASIGISF